MGRRKRSLKKAYNRGGQDLLKAAWNNHRYNVDRSKKEQQALAHRYESINARLQRLEYPTVYFTNGQYQSLAPKVNEMLKRGAYTLAQVKRVTDDIDLLLLRSSQEKSEYDKIHLQEAIDATAEYLESNKMPLYVEGAGEFRACVATYTHYLLEQGALEVNDTEKLKGHVLHSLNTEEGKQAVIRCHNNAEVVGTKIRGWNRQTNYLKQFFDRFPNASEHYFPIFNRVLPLLPNTEWYPSISSKKLAKANSSFCNQSHYVFAFIDTTLFGSGKLGVCFTPTTCFYRYGKSSSGQIDLVDISSSNVSAEDVEVILVNGIELLKVSDKQDRRVILSLFKAIAQHNSDFDGEIKLDSLDLNETHLTFSSSEATTSALAQFRNIASKVILVVSYLWGGLILLIAMIDSDGSVSIGMMLLVYAIMFLPGVLGVFLARWIKVKPT